MLYLPLNFGHTIFNHPLIIISVKNNWVRLKYLQTKQVLAGQAWFSRLF